MMNIKFGNKKLKANAVVQIYGYVGCGKTVLASRIVQDIKEVTNAKVITLDARAVDLDTIEFFARLKMLLEEVKSVTSPIVLVIDGMDNYEEGKKEIDPVSFLVYDIVTTAIKSEFCCGVVLVSQHVIPEFTAKEDILIQVGRYLHKRDTRYMAILQTPITTYPIVDVTCETQNQIVSCYNFFGYSDTGITYS